MKRDSELPAAGRKVEMRRELRQRIEALATSFRAEASLVICEIAAQLPAFRAAGSVAVFAPLPSEPDIHPLIEEAWAQGKAVALPRLWRENDVPQLAWHRVTRWAEVIEPGPFGLREPDPAQCPSFDAAQFDCVFVPGLGFDATGLRLGRGGGYYDRFLGQISRQVPRYGLMFGSQKVEALPREPHDQALAAIVTEDGVISFDSSDFAAVRSIQPPPSTSSPA